MATRTMVLDEPDRKEIDITGDDGLVEHVVYVRVADHLWIGFGQCPKCGDVNACACDRSGRDEEQWWDGRKWFVLDTVSDEFVSGALAKPAAVARASRLNRALERALAGDGTEGEAHG